MFCFFVDALLQIFRVNHCVNISAVDIPGAEDAEDMVNQHEFWNKMEACIINPEHTGIMFLLQQNLFVLSFISNSSRYVYHCILYWDTICSQQIHTFL